MAGGERGDDEIADLSHDDLGAETGEDAVVLLLLVGDLKYFELCFAQLNPDERGMRNKLGHLEVAGLCSCWGWRCHDAMFVDGGDAAAEDV